MANLRVIITIAFVCPPLLTVGTAYGGIIEYVSQQRAISAILREVYQFPDDEPIELTDYEDAVAPDFAPFDASVTAMISDPPDGRETGIVTASQRSTLGDEGIAWGGSFSSFTSTSFGGLRFDSLLDATFTTDGAMNYDLNFEAGNFFLPGDGNGGSLRATLSKDESVEPVFEIDNPLAEDGTFSGKASGNLDAGTYRFRIELSIGGDIGQSGEYSATLVVSDTPVSPIPLPSTAWAAGLTGGALLAADGVRRRRSAAYIACRYQAVKNALLFRRRRRRVLMSERRRVSRSSHVPCANRDQAAQSNGLSPMPVGEPCYPQFGEPPMVGGRRSGHTPLPV
jgi:hypothetical protein